MPLLSSFLTCSPPVNHLVLPPKHIKTQPLQLGFPDNSTGKESACNAGDTGDTSSSPGLGRFSEKGNGNPLQSSCLGNFMGRGVGCAIVHGFAESWTRQSARAHPCPPHSFKGCVLPTSLILQNYPGDLFKLMKKPLYSFHFYQPKGEQTLRGLK